MQSCSSRYRIKWRPVVLTFTFPSKETKNGKDPLIPIRARLEDVDIKTIIPYARSATTHVVAGKRNTAKCLQALINGVPIVDNTYLAALEHAATPVNLDEPESLSPLEHDFDAQWPDPSQHLPPPGQEPDPRAPELFEPDAARRRDVFRGYTFVFGDRKQFDNLRPPIADGGGKALYLDVKNGQTTPAEVVELMKDAAGEHGLGPFTDKSCGPGVVLVRFQGGKDYQGWADELHNEVRRMTEQECVEQNEFLDAILTANPTRLRRRLPASLATDSQLRRRHRGK